MTTSALGPLAGRELPVFDLHTHPSLKTCMFGHKFWKKHNPPGFMFPPCMRTDIDALIDGGVKTILASVYVVEKTILQDARPLNFLRHLLPRVDRILAEEPDDMAREFINSFKEQVDETVKRKGDVVEIGYSYSDYQRITAAGKVCILHSMEGAHHLNGKLENLEDFFKRGVCHMILPHFYPNEACGCVDPIPDNLFLRKLGMMNYKRDPDTGLTDFGCELADRMWDLGMIVDVTHATPRCRKEVYARALAHEKKRPVIMSHVGVYALAPLAMNPTEEDIRAIAETGGVVGIIFMDYWLKQPPEHVCADIILQTIDHLIAHGGEDCVAFGSDFDGFTSVPKDFKSPRDYNRLRELLKKRYTPTQVEKFLSGNADRVLREGWGKQ
jgi:membrane dipeptidase